ncbi:MAG TPA: exonuclease [Rhodospirillaceae bacterium]|jgi:hypothetical protein|nr:YqaJ viral recombinase family protein [Alphaproteobacteria bacterium]HBH26542.1 exonuclease [Rhodospirillaceae bacterium]
MKHHRVPQNSPEWHALRCGIPTASCFGKILTSRGEPSSQAEDYRALLLGERMTGQPSASFVSLAMEDGVKREAPAASYYALLSDEPVELAGVFTDDAVRYGASPDRLVGERGVLEIKCPQESTHIKNLARDCIPAIYFPQVQGQMFLAEREWCDWMSDHPDHEPAIIRVERDDAWIAKLERALDEFCDRLDEEENTALLNQERSL